MRVFKDTQNNNARITFADLGVTWMSEEAIAARGLVEVDEDYQAPVSDAEKLSAAKSPKQNIIKQLLADTDYKCLKYVDGELTSAEYSTIKTYRTSLRAAFNEVDEADTVEEVEAVEIPVLE